MRLYCSPWRAFCVTKGQRHRSPPTSSKPPMADSGPTPLKSEVPRQDTRQMRNLEADWILDVNLVSGYYLVRSSCCSPPSDLWQNGVEELPKSWKPSFNMQKFVEGGFVSKFTRSQHRLPKNLQDMHQSEHTYSVMVERITSIYKRHLHPTMCSPVSNNWWIIFFNPLLTTNIETCSSATHDNRPSKPCYNHANRNVICDSLHAVLSYVSNIILFVYTSNLILARPAVTYYSGPKRWWKRGNSFRSGWHQLIGISWCSAQWVCAGRSSGSGLSNGSGLNNGKGKDPCPCHYHLGWGGWLLGGSQWFFIMTCHILPHALSAIHVITI